MSRKTVFTLPIVGICLALAVALIMNAGNIFAQGTIDKATPYLYTYQGYLTDTGGSPYEGDTQVRFRLYEDSSSSSLIWEEEYSSIPVSGGYFSLTLGQQKELSPDLFKSDERYLQVSIDTTQSSNYVDLPSQQLTSVPYAFVANAVPWSGVRDVPAGFADGTDDGASYENVVVVAKSGGDYTTITEAMNAITPSMSSHYLVYVAPGTYEEQVTVPEYVHLMGAGPHTTVISGAIVGNVNAAEAAVVTLGANSQLSQIGVVNSGAGTTNNDNSVGVRVQSGNEWTELSHLHIRVSGAGGARHVGVYTTGGQSTMNHVYAEASGANAAGAGGGNNWGMSQNGHNATIDSSTFYGDGSAGGSVSGIRINGGDSTITNSNLWARNAASATALDISGAGQETRVDHSVLSGDNLAVSQTNGNTTTTYIGASQVGGGAVETFGTLRCAQSYDENYSDVAATCN